MSSWEVFQLFVQWCVEIYFFQDISYFFVELVVFLVECCLEPLSDRHLYMFTRNNLSGNCDFSTWSDIDLSWLRFEFTKYHLEDRRFSRSILSHDRDLRIFSDRKIRFLENYFLFILSVMKWHIIKTKNNVITSSWHNYFAYNKTMPYDTENTPHLQQLINLTKKSSGNLRWFFIFNNQILGTTHSCHFRYFSIDKSKSFRHHHYLF